MPVKTDAARRWCTLVSLGVCASTVMACKPKASSEPPQVAAATAEPAEPDPLALLDADIRDAVRLLKVPGLSIAVVHEGEVVLARGYGVRELGKPEPVDPDTVFAIASNTKAFVATTVGMLVADGELKWDDRVHEHLPELTLWDDYTTEHMRVRDLLSHRSGLATWAGDLVWIGSKVQTDELLQRLQHVPAAHDFRERYGYTNLMYVVAGEVIEAKTGKPWHAVVRERLLEPLGMDRTVATVDALKNMDNVATPHMEVDGELVTIPYLDVDNASAPGAFNSSVADMAKWLQLQLGDGKMGDQQIVPAAVIEETREPHTLVPRRGGSDPNRGNLTAYGLGWVLFDYAGRGVVTHSGGLPGMISRVVMVPQAELGVVVLTNAESPAASLVAMMAVDRILGVHAPDRLGDALGAIADKERAKSVPEPPGETPASLPLPRYAGSYHNPLLGLAEVVAQDDALTLDVVDHGNLRCTLKHADADTFDCVWNDPIFEQSRVTFDVDGKQVKALRFKVRPQFVDPLEYRFEPGKPKRPGSKRRRSGPAGS